MRLSSTAVRLVLALGSTSFAAAGCGGDPGGGSSGADAGESAGADAANGNGDGNGNGDAQDRFTYLDQIIMPEITQDGPTCCKDFGDISANPGIDNAFANLANALEDFEFLEFDFQGTIDAQLQEGRLVVLLEHLALAGDTATFSLDGFFGAFAGSTTYAEASAGSGTFTIDPLSYDDAGDPIIHFESAELQAGELSTQPAVIGFASPIGNEVLQLGLYGAEVTGTATLSDGAVAYADGGLAGYLLLDEIFEALNGYLTSEECACLGLDGADVFAKGTDGEWSGENCVSEHTCDADSACAQMAEGGSFSVCQTLPPVLHNEADITTDPELDAPDGLSVGFEFTGVAAAISE